MTSSHYRDVSAPNDVIMSWLKRFGGGKSKSKQAKGASQSPRTPQEAANAYGMTPEEMAEAETQYPALAKNKDRLSVSRSGRHKVKSKQRTILQDETYASKGPMGAPRTVTSSSTPAGASHSGAYSKTPMTSSNSYAPAPSTGASASRGHAPQPPQPTSNSNARRYPAVQSKNMPRQQTAV